MIRMAVRKRTFSWTRAFCALACVAAVMSLLPSARAQDRTRDDDSYDWSHWREFWSFKPIRKSDPPPVKDAAWVRNPIDAFVLAKLEEKSLKPAPEADRYTLIRRATFDLTGLPP